MIVVAVIAIVATFKKCFMVVGPDKAIVRTGRGVMKVVTGEGMMVYPVIHRYELMDLSAEKL